MARTLLVLATLALLGGGFVAWHIFFPAGRMPQTVEIKIEPGESFSTVVRKLREHRIIDNEAIFYLWARLSGAEKKIQWGLYRFELPLSPYRVLKQMVSGKRVFHRVTIPEGLTVKEIAELLAGLAIVDKQRFLTEAASPDFLAELGVRGRTIEGYLFPDTYQFVPATPEREIIRVMVQQFRRMVEPLARQQAPGGLTPHEILILASIIEKETAIDAERPLVSAVFHNRLRLNMPLQSDPTVIYGIKEFDGNLTRKDLQHPSPYNTYRTAWLPPGPICNPGLSSIKAALEPASVPYLYFVSKNDGTHFFSETLEAHNRAVRVYQRRAESAPARVR
ncbi:MAG TPA: endolytic transglycosylase MltG [Candidatus Eisenbacteria bacterium]|nr:endolytic transglycosylase MltG [Candidatus Eisenbacteria bacterium]